jgi:hypothetical protein
MARLVALSGFISLGLLTGWFLTVAIMSKRSDITWGRLFLAGPLVVVRPDIYLSAKAASKVPLFVTFWIGLFVLTAVSAAVASS